MKYIFAILLISVFFISCERESPKDRNFLAFPNGNTDEIIDSLKSFKRMVISYNFPVYKDLNFISFRYLKNNFEISQQGIGVLNYENLRNATFLNHLSDEQVKDFLKLYKYLFGQYITPGKYYLNNDIIIFDYKKYYYMYDNLTHDGDLFRFIVLLDSSDTSYLDSKIILDSYKNLYLYALKYSKIKSDNVKYRIDPKFRIE